MGRFQNLGRRKRRAIVWVAGLLQASVFLASANNSLHTTYLWHLHQPIYWPDRRNYGTDHYEAAWDTIQQQNAGRPHPSPEVLSTIFGLDDRKAAYQYRLRDSLNTILWLPNAGAQVSYSGALMENVQSLGAAGQLGYGSAWYQPNQQARGWTTSGGKPRMDLVNFTYHHALAPLLSDETLEMELRIHQRHMDLIWGTSPPHSRGYFPTETCFSERMIPILKKLGVEWAIIANNHLSRACADFPFVAGSGGENCDIPNKADQLNPPQGAGNYKRISIDRGISPAAAMPLAYQPHLARYVDPETGAESKLIVVPSDQALGWKDSYGTWDLGLMDDLAARNDPAKPALVMFAHDGDNAWSGGYSYYMEWVGNFNSQANSRGYEPTTIEQFLADHPPNSNDVVHVEDGGWVYADSDFGSPIMINWHWPPSYSSGGRNVVDPGLGVSDKADNWRVIIATENRVKTAQQIQNTLTGYTNRIDQIRDPGSFGAAPQPVELGWHYYLASLDSGFVYYGCHDDECHRAVVAQSNAVRNVDALINPSYDLTPPTVFIPQRHPWNPGGQNFGVQYNYTLTNMPNTDFFVWTYAYDVSGITNVSLKFRLNSTPPTNVASKVYAGGTWITSNMTQRVVPPVIGVSPQYIADYYWTKVTGVPGDTYVDYYVTATDARGNTYKSPIQHVYVSTPTTGGGGGPTNGCSGRVCVAPVPPVAGNSATITFSPAGGPLAGASQIYIHLGWNNWNPVVLPDAAMTAVSNTWQYVVTIPSNATQLDCVFNNGAGTWDSNNGADWHFAVTNTAPPPPPGPPPFVLNVDNPTNYPGYKLGATGSLTLYAAVRGSTLYVATTSPGNSGPNDHFVLVSDQLLASPATASPWAKVGGISIPSGKVMLCGESQGSYVGWQFITGSTATASNSSGKAATSAGQLQGTIDLVQAFGSMPATLYLSAAAYTTTNGGFLVAQTPAGNGNLNIESNEFLAVPVAAITDSAGNGAFDFLDPLRAFAIQNVQSAGSGFVVSWPSVPGRAYQLMYCDALGDAWSSNGIPAMIAGSGQSSMTYTDATASATTQRFYRVQVLP